MAVTCMLGFATPLQAANEIPSGVSDDVVANAFLRDQIRSVMEQVRSYSGGLKSLTQDPKHLVQAKAAESKIEGLLRRAGKLVAENRMKEALAAADEANRLVVESIVKMRSGETVVVSLSFDSPAQEFAYEKRRFESSEVMVSMALDDGRSVGPEARKNLDAMLAEARSQSSAGTREAGAGKYSEAVRTLEGANRKMTRVLQELGVPVF